MSENITQFPSNKNLPFIQTQVYETLLGLFRMITDPDLLFSFITIITGEVGIGISTSIDHYLMNYQPLSQTGIPSRLKVKVPRYSALVDLVRCFAVVLKEDATAWRKSQYVSKLVNILKINQIQLIVVDDGHNLKSEMFLFLGDLQKETNIPIVIAGHSYLAGLVNQNKFFSAYIGYETSIEGMDLDEFSKFLPQLPFPRLQINSDDDKDKSMIELIWSCTCPNLRKVFILLQTADLLAKNDKTKSKIEMKHIKKAIQVSKPNMGDGDKAKAETGDSEGHQ